MSDTSSVLSLPLIQPSQAQKHVTHNEALQVLDVIVQLAVIAADQSAPPAVAAAGDRYIVAGAGSGDWAGHADEIAVYDNGLWRFVTPQPGWLAQVLNPAGAIVYDATEGWKTAPLGAVKATQLGINTAADDVNRLSLSAPATLLNHAGAGHQLKLNKATAGDTASLLYQTGFSGRAEMGLAGDDSFAIKVSPDGAQWHEALRVDPATGGGIEIPQNVQISGLVSGNATQAAVHDTTPGRLLTTGAFGWGQDGSTQSNTDLATCISSGVHQFAPTDPDRPIATGGAVMVVRYAQQWLTQLVFAPNNSEIWLRRTQNNGAIWSAWVPLTPERGSNANGEFVRFADGTMMCSARRASSATQTSTWTFPSAFINAGAVVTASALSTGAHFAAIGAISQTTCNFSVYATNGNRTSQTTNLVALGRWF